MTRDGTDPGAEPAAPGSDTSGKATVAAAAARADTTSRPARRLRRAARVTIMSDGPASAEPPSLAARFGSEFTGRWRRARRNLARWFEQHGSLLLQLTESLALPGIALGLGWLARPHDPLFVGAPFPWAWLGPWLVALRYGSLWAMPGVLAMLALWQLSAVEALETFPKEYFLGGCLTLILIGEFSSMWRGRAATAQQLADALHHKGEALTRRLYLMKLSHDELEADLVERPSTLRDALRELRQLMRSATIDRSEPLPGARQLIAFLEMHGSLLAAGIYRMHWRGGWHIEEAAHIGPMVAPQQDDPMIEQAVAWGRLVHVQLQAEASSALLAAQVLYDEHAEPYALLAVRDMPLLALTEDNLRKVAVLFDSYGDYLRALRGGMAESLPTDWRQAPAELLAECALWIRIGREHGEISHLVVWRVTHPDLAVCSRAWAALSQRHVVSGNAWHWPSEREGRLPSALVVVLGLADQRALRIYTQRIIDEVAQIADDEAARACHWRSHILENAAAVEWLRAELEQGP